MKPPLRLVPREPVPCDRPSWVCEEARAELTVSLAERRTFLTAVRHHVSWAHLNLRNGRPDSAGSHLGTLARLATQEHARTAAAGIRDDEPQAVAA